MKTILGILAVLVATVSSRGGEIEAVAHPAEKLTHSRVEVWTPLMQAAWDELYGGFGKPVKVEPPNPLMDLLDRFEWKAESVMPPGQRVKFALSEKGGKVRAEVEMEAMPLSAAPPPPPPVIPRVFRYDRPFFVFLWRRGAEWPYFGAWIGNAEVMEAFKKR